MESTVALHECSMHMADLSSTANLKGMSGKILEQLTRLLNSGVLGGFNNYNIPKASTSTVVKQITTSWHTRKREREEYTS